jgi:ionotropic glutamate receptor
MGSRPVRVSSYSLLVSLILLLFVDTNAWTVAPVVRVRVGVILSSRASSSGWERAAIEMAFEDYYAAHPRSTTRVDLHFRDSTGDVLGAASAGN